MLSRLFNLKKTTPSSNKDAANHTTSQTSFPFPKEIVLTISQFLLLPDLFHFGMTCSFTLKLLFNQTPQIVIQRLKEKEKKQKKQNLSLVLKENSIIELYKKQDEECKTKSKVNDENFEFVQNMIWKNLVKHYFIRFSSSGVKNWMHVLRRRIIYLMDHDRPKLPLVTSIHRQEEELLISRLDDFKQLTPCSSDLDFIEKCDHLYNCPLHLSSIETRTYVDSVYCHECDRQIGLARTPMDFTLSYMSLAILTQKPVTVPPKPAAKK
ncbi:hypothetical protein C9374_000475 [Naegleria lovaniensis]|uniref:F-box domain-containing protein n=1 Tax=Naegleria lovaniensis TaxID=51637 RepID=A0AA88GYF6_NAELO|nr:uncharacterized protein C9374_000475 [Naegleria lovaniensis]KAG2388311.1 hypothetical protein C9374_000475 [Naegleria lovaniensis]